MHSTRGIHTLNSFGYRNVSLKSSHWRRQRDETIELYLGIANEDLLHIFRQKAGLESGARGLAGWYGGGASTFGQMLGAFAKLYLVTGDCRLKEKAIYLADEWMRCADQSDRLLENDTYIFDKLIGGFLDLYEYLGYGKVLKYVSRLTEYAIGHFKKDIKKDGIQDSELSSQNMIEWYTLPENLYRAYQLTGEVRYKEFAAVWDYTFYWDKLYRRDLQMESRHAYSHVNCLSSAARAYETTRDERYLTVMKNAYEEITAGHIFATGGYGPGECLFSRNEGYLGDSLKSPWDPTLKKPVFVNFAGKEVARSDAWGSCEISCCAWAVFKFCNYLLQYTGDAKYGSWAEMMLYNGTGGQIPIERSGKVMYYAGYFIDGAIKTVEDRRLQEGGYGFQWQCCTGTFPQDVAEYANMLYYYDCDSIYISQYLPSVLEWKKDGTALRIENDSLYPEESTIKLRISVERSVEFALKLRVPVWAASHNSLSVNGKPLDLELIPGQWARVQRVWHDGDIVTIDFPFTLHFSPVDDINPDVAALKYGPLVLVADEMTHFEGDIGKPASWIHPAEGDGLTFVTDRGHVKGYDFLTRTFSPYYKVGPMQWYYMYNRINPPGQ